MKIRTKGRRGSLSLIRIRRKLGGLRDRLRHTLIDWMKKGMQEDMRDKEKKHNAIWNR